MAIADKLTKLSTDITNAYDEIENKGGTIPANKNTDNLASAIGSISTGTTPTGTIQINNNGIYDVTNYASANVDVSSSDGALFDTYEGDVELYDDVNNLDIPIDVRNYDYIYGQAYCIATGTYQDGVVTETDNLTILPSGVCVYNQVFTTFPTMPLTMYRNETATTTGTPGNSGYSYSSAGMNFSGVGLINGCSVLNDSIRLATQNGGRKYCRDGYYHKFHYIVYALKRNTQAGLLSTISSKSLVRQNKSYNLKDNLTLEEYEVIYEEGEE